MNGGIQTVMQTADAQFPLTLSLGEREHGIRRCEIPVGLVLTDAVDVNSRSLG